jgi:hypothetical protein
LSLKKLAGKIPEIGYNISAAITAAEIQIKNEILRQFKPVYDKVVNEVITDYVGYIDFFNNQLRKKIR